METCLLVKLNGRSESLTMNGIDECQALPMGHFISVGAIVQGGALDAYVRIQICNTISPFQRIFIEHRLKY